MEIPAISLSRTENNRDPSFDINIKHSPFPKQQIISRVDQASYQVPLFMFQFASSPRPGLGVPLPPK